jgi:hypothetical protein
MYGPFGMKSSCCRVLSAHSLLRTKLTHSVAVYHVHALPITDGNCTTSMGHLDPTNRGELHACELAAPQTCQAGDLAGKHGNVTSVSFLASYTDLYLSTDPNSPYFFGNKSIVIHSTNTTRLTCANFAMASNSTTTSGSSSTPTPSSTGGASSGMQGTVGSGATRIWDNGSVVLSAILSAMAFLLFLYIN